eukprot:CAMPEP_0169251664 /NCGR_PEP_ID=MMETSP1016-20121227/37638_2 /TAXON_ID=342587 /ORGANISM="Karlodinium micrum, Strain CCMP2283" /LENGTH=69 /DNA_ID=CAMNT_0009332825 /DNA_START=1648 /DNA_END=1854 /DNA_ORIENTATION=-
MRCFDMSVRCEKHCMKNWTCESEDSLRTKQLFVFMPMVAWAEGEANIRHKTLSNLFVNLLLQLLEHAKN